MPSKEIAFTPPRVLLQDFTGAPAVGPPSMLIVTPSLATRAPLVPLNGAGRIPGGQIEVRPRPINFSFYVP